MSQADSQVDSQVDIVRDGHCAHLVLRRAQRRNALDRALVDDLYAAAAEVEHDPDVHCVVVRGDGPAFCAGIDAATLVELATPAGLRDIRGAFVRAFDRLQAMAKPTVAQVHGAAIGAGFELALACDLRVVAADATMGLPETRMGVVPDVGACSRLTALVGAGRAKELIMTSAMIDGVRAGELGIANRVAAADALAEATSVLVGELLACSPSANGLVKGIIDHAAMPAQAAVSDAELVAQLSCIHTPEFRAAAEAFRSAPASNGRPAPVRG
jgi:enoyl-CoA hydratase/carnithine racemase